MSGRTDGSSFGALLPANHMTARPTGLVAHAHVEAHQHGTGIASHGVLTLIGPVDDTDQDATVRIRFPGLGRLRLHGRLESAPFPHPDGDPRLDFTGQGDDWTLRLALRLRTTHDGETILLAEGRLARHEDTYAVDAQGDATPL